MLGQDARLNEYWHFKDDQSKIFMKRYVLVEKPVKKVNPRGEECPVDNVSQANAEKSKNSVEEGSNKEDHEMDNGEKDELNKEDDVDKTGQAEAVNEGDIGDENGPIAVPEYKLEWVFIDEEDKFDQLLDSLNIKGIKEKRLQESLRKIRFSIKMKKGKKLSPV